MDDIDAAVGKEFAVRLRATPGTGYLWHAQTVPDGIELVASDIERADQPVHPGDVVTQVFRFRPRQPGNYVIVMSLQRQWETAGAETHAMKIKVSG